MHAGRDACIRTRSLVCRQAIERPYNTSRTRSALGPIVAFCCAGIGFTGAHLPHERVDREDGVSGISDEVIDATGDCVPVAPKRVAFEAPTAHVGLVRDDGRALARLLVVERKKGRRADTSGRAQHECCERDHTEASSA